MDKYQPILDLIAEVLESDLGAGGLLERVVCKLSAAFPAQLCSMLILNDEEPSEFIFQRHDQSSPQRIYNLDASVIEVFRGCLSSSEPLLLNNLSQDERLAPLALATGVKLESLICLPMTSGKIQLGALILGNHDPGSLDREHLEMLEPVGSVLAHRLHTMQTIHSLQVANAELEVIRWQLTNSRNILRALFDSIPTSIYIIDRKFNLAAVNMHRARRTGLPPNQLVGRRCFQALFQLDDPCPDCRVLDTLFGGQSTSRTRRHWETDFEPQEWEISTYPILDDNEQVTQAILLEQDVTEKRRLEATLAQSEKLAAVGQLAAGLAHEINNPLTAIIANAQLLQRELPAGDDKQELVDLIARAGARANQVVRNLLDLARKEHYDFAPVDINENIRKALTFLQHEFTNRAIELVFEPEQDLPEVVASPDHLQGVWINLLSNAIDALEEGRRLIRVATYHLGSEVHVSITDTGTGIAPQNLAHIFEPFFTTKGPGHGTGLGLSVCHRVVKQHGGSILVESQLGVGTQFTVVLPAA